MSTLSTHILDISTGKPAEGVTVHLEQDGKIMATGVTNASGRIAFVPPWQAATGWWRRSGRGLAKPAARRSIPARRLSL
jgi:5-hydroxyisourate hydrolase